MPPPPEGRAEGGTDTVWFIRYHDTYRSTDSGWRFARRELHLQWVEERPIAAPGILPTGWTPLRTTDLQTVGTGWGGGGPA